MIHPFSRNKNYFFLYISTWIIFSIVQVALLHLKFDLELIYAIPDALIYNISFGFLASVVWYMSFLNSYRILDIISFFTQHILGAIIIIYIWVKGSEFILDTIFISPEYGLFNENAEFWRYVIGVFYYIITAMVFTLIQYNESKKVELEQISRFEKTAIKSELKALKSQLNPHFLFNSLNSISYLTLSDGFKAHEMLVKLSNYMRYAIRKNENHYTTLKEELENARSYIDIEKVRFEDRINYIENIEQDLNSEKVPHMILQPLLENSIKYGVYESNEVVEIELSIKRENNLIKIEVKNDYIEDSHQHKGEGIGLNNIRDRLKLLYDSENLIQLIKDEKKFTVIIIIPYLEEAKSSKNE